MADETLATRRDAQALHADLSATLSGTREAISLALDRAQRRLVLRVSGIMVATVAAMVFLMWGR